LIGEESRLFDQLQHRWLHLLLALALLIALSPTPIPEPVVGSLRSANIALDAGRLDEALNLIDLAMAFENAREGLSLPAAEIALAADEPLRALNYLNRTSSLISQNGIEGCLRSRAFLAIGNLEQATLTWKKVGKTCPNAVPFLFTLAQAYLKEDDPISARSILEELLSLEPLHEDGLYSFALITSSSDPVEALPFLLQIDSLSPGAKPLSNALIKTIEGATPLDEPSYTLAQVGQTFARHGEWQMATWAFQTALTLNPDYIEARAYLGLALDRSGQDGLQHLMNATEAASDAALPRIFLAMHWQERGQPEIALEQLELASRLDPTNPAVNAELGSVYAVLGETRSAIAAYRQATELAPEDPRFWNLLAQYSLTNEIEVQTLGLPAARNAVVLNPNDPASLDSLGYAHFLVGNLRLSERLLWRATNLAPQRADIQYHLGLLRYAQGEDQRARAAFSMAILLDPGGPIGQLADRILTNIRP
jgi:tetratricopeptide (TPR) repeat protein